MKLNQLCYATLFFFTFIIAHGQNELLHERFEFESELNYNPNIPSPASFLGYELGEALTLYAHLEQYIQKVASMSDRVLINQYGETYEGRKLYNLVISSPDNINNIDEIRSNNLKIMDPVNYPDYSSDEVIKKAPVFMSFSYNIHGNETSSSEAAMQVIYRLAAANDSETLKLLENAITIIYPCINPDGRDRYVYWYKSSKRNVLGKEPRDLEHYEPFPNGRTNHYWFDLNRDWIWGVHPESRGHTSEYLKWMPHLHTDYHEMGYNSNYFTMPGTTPRNKLLPDAYEPLSDTIGMANVAAFNEYKVNYFTRESFDFFYPGYGSSYPSVMGAIGMLVEQGGISGGRAVETNDGYILTLRQRVYDHYRTSMATLGKAVDKKDLFIKYSHDANNPKLSKSPTKAYIVKNNGSPYIQDFLKIMNHHGISVEQFAVNTNLNGRNYQNGKEEQCKFNAGDYVVSANSNKHLFIHSIMARNLAIEDSVMYDMATWSLPLAYNLEAYEISTAIPQNQLRALEKAPTASAPEVVPEAYAITIDWKQRNAPKALSMLWDKGYRVRVAEKAFKIGGIDYAPGTLVLLIGRNWEKKDVISTDIQSIAKETGISYQVQNTGRVESGVDLASNDVRPLKKPKLGMLVGAPFDAYTSGQIYFLFDQETAFPIERIRTEILQETAFPKFGTRYGLASIFDYDVIILPGGGNGLKALLDEESEKLWKLWIEKGGKLIATESAAEFFTKGSSKIADVELIKPKPDTSQAAAQLKYEERTDYFGKTRVPGSAVNSIVDISNPLGYGVDQNLYSLKFGNKALKPSLSLQTVVRYSESDNLLVAGYVNDDTLQLLGGQTGAGVLPVGQGKIIYLLDNTQFRMFWRGPSRMMQNAVMF